MAPNQSRNTEELFLRLFFFLDPLSHLKKNSWREREREKESTILLPTILTYSGRPDLHQEQCQQSGEDCLRLHAKYDGPVPAKIEDSNETFS
jgi:hypothetical protein